MRWFWRPAACVILWLAAAHPAAAQTVLTLAASGQATVPPDEMVASLTVQESAAQAAAAAAAVNAAMRQALAAARAVAGVTAATADYNEQATTDDNGRPTGFQASQTLNLSMPAPAGSPPAAFTDLVGRLQQTGLLLNQLDGDLSDAGQAAAQQAAITDAIHQLQATAARVAAALGDRVTGIKTLQVNLQDSGPVMPRQMMAMAAPAAPPPQAAPGPVTVTANVSADIELAAAP